MKKVNFKNLESESFQGDIGSYKIVTTQDNSRTLWSEYFDECAHSLDGAIEETLYNYIEGTKVRDKLKKFGKVNIFEMGYATGIGAELTFQQIKDDQHCFFVSTELDSSLVEWSQTQCSHPLIKSLVKKQFEDLTYYHSKNNNCELIVLLGDARKSVVRALNLGIIQNFDCFYQDPFSPKKNPTLWTKEWFELLKRIAAPDAILSTYSASTSVRKAMHAAGWGVFNRSGFHGKRASTYAKINEKTAPDVLLKLEQSSVPPLSDEQISHEQTNK